MDLIALLTQWGVPLVLASVLLEQSGVDVQGTRGGARDEAWALLEPP